jgi:hypothetical protein
VCDPRRAFAARTELVTTAVDRAVFTRGGHAQGVILHQIAAVPTTGTPSVPSSRHRDRPRLPGTTRPHMVLRLRLADNGIHPE